MSVTPQTFHYHLKHLVDTEKYLIAYSGGVDSHVLLHLCSQLKNSPGGFGKSFSAVYIDHGLSNNSKKWGHHCQHICFELDIPLTLIEVNARPMKGQSTEASARIARYQAFSQLLDDNECLLTAQHMDDQAETLFLQLLRGSGTKGLSAMPRVKIFAGGYLCRPLLDYKKQVILDYARQHQLEWIEDESNQEEHYDRNYLRRAILPSIVNRWPAMQMSFAKSADLMAESQELMDEVAANDIREIVFTNNNGMVDHHKLRLKPLLKILKNSEKASEESIIPRQHHKHARLNNVLRYWINLNHLPLPSKKILEQVIISVIQTREDATPVVRWKRNGYHTEERTFCEIRKYRNVLYLLDVSDENPRPETRPEKNKQQQQNKTFCLSENEPLVLNQINSIIKLDSCHNNTEYKHQPYDREKLLSKKITVHFRKGGERIRKTTKSHSQQLKHWFQEHGIPPWERKSLPLIYWGDELIQVGNVIVHQSLGLNLKANGSNKSVFIHWIRQDLDEITHQKR